MQKSGVFVAQTNRLVQKIRGTHLFLGASLGDLENTRTFVLKCKERFRGAVGKGGNAPYFHLSPELPSFEEKNSYL